jgi:hypothetical protein
MVLWHNPGFADALNTSKLDSNWLVETNALDGSGKQIYALDENPIKTKVQMEDATFADGTKQSLYFSLGHPKEGLFKEMQVILEEQGIMLDSKKKRECPSFRCLDKGQVDWCYYWVFLISHILPWWRTGLKPTTSLMGLRLFSCQNFTVN